jgi:hypothetical protein
MSPCVRGVLPTTIWYQESGIYFVDVDVVESKARDVPWQFAEPERDLRKGHNRPGPKDERPIFVNCLDVRKVNRMDRCSCRNVGGARKCEPLLAF